MSQKRKAGSANTIVSLDLMQQSISKSMAEIIMNSDSAAYQATCCELLQVQSVDEVQLQILNMLQTIEAENLNKANKK